MSEAELSSRPALVAMDVRSPGSLHLTARLIPLMHEGGRYLVASLAALAVDYGLLVVLTEVCRLHYLVSSAISYSAGAVLHYGLCIGMVFRVHRLKDRRMEFAGFFGAGLVGLAVTQAVLWLAVSGLGLSYLLAKIGATGASFVVGYAIRKMWLFTRPR